MLSASLDCVNSIFLLESAYFKIINNINYSLFKVWLSSGIFFKYYYLLGFLAINKKTVRFMRTICLDLCEGNKRLMSCQDGMKVRCGILLLRGEACAMLLFGS